VSSAMSGGSILVASRRPRWMAKSGVMGALREDSSVGFEDLP